LIKNRDHWSRVARALIRAPLVAELRRRDAIEDWLFIRYADPEPHLRLRFRGAALVDTALAGDVRAGRLWRLMHDTYERRLERYGGDAAMPLVERILRRCSIARATRAAISSRASPRLPRARRRSRPTPPRCGPRPTLAS
jgi:thiopeptide-type bacteriocin biosynthesis protein